MDDNIPGFPGYHIARGGKLYNRGKPKPTYVHKNGYLRSRLRNEKGKTYNKTIHRLVAIAWVPNPKPGIYNTVLHNDNIRLHNFDTNLHWGTQQENIDQAIKDGIMNVKGKNNPMYGVHRDCRGKVNKTLSGNKKTQVRGLYKTGNYKLTELAKKFSVGTKNIKRIINI